MPSTWKKNAHLTNPNIIHICHNAHNKQKILSDMMVPISFLTNLTLFLVCKSALTFYNKWFQGMTNGTDRNPLGAIYCHIYNGFVDRKYRKRKTSKILQGLGLVQASALECWP